MSPQMMPAQKHCAACDRVWQDYIQAMTAHVKVVARRRHASLQNDAAVLDAIEAIEADLGQQQLRARRDIDDHEAEHEPV
jgi:argininosuccinate lyase